MKGAITKNAVYRKGRMRKDLRIPVVQEVGLDLSLNSHPCARIIHSPGEEKELVAGFLMTQGMVRNPEEITHFNLFEKNGKKTAEVIVSGDWVSEGTRTESSNEIVLQNSTGLSREIKGKPEEAIRMNHPEIRFTADQAAGFLTALSSCQPLREETRASHAAAFFDKKFRMLASAEDAGRHNAFDKAAGKVLLQKDRLNACIVAVSSRISYELVQKAVFAGVSVMLSVSRPTSMAVDKAEEAGITLACFSRDDGLYIFSGEYRFAEE